MEYAHGSFRFFGMFFLHWCFHVFLYQGRTTRRSISTPKPEQTSSSKTTRIPTQIATCFFRNHGITSMTISQQGGITMTKPSICPSIFQRLFFSPKKAGNNKEFRTSQFRSHNKEIHPNHEISHITYIYKLHHYTTCYTYIIIHHYESLHHYTSLYAHHTYNIAYYIKTNVIYTSWCQMSELPHHIYTMPSLSWNHWELKPL